MKENLVITIGRQYGSGGHEIGIKLAEALGIKVYDKELLTVAAQKSGMCREIFETNDEKPSSSFLYSLVTGGLGGNNLPINHKLFLAQFEAIRSIAYNEPCVIIGRCADYALEDYENLITVFIHADIEERKKRVMKRHNVPENKVVEEIMKTDKRRSSYYNFYSGNKWGNLDNYDITVDSGKLGIDKTVELLVNYVKLKQEIKNQK